MPKTMPTSSNSNYGTCHLGVKCSSPYVGIKLYTGVLTCHTPGKVLYDNRRITRMATIIGESKVEFAITTIRILQIPVFDPKCRKRGCHRKRHDDLTFSVTVTLPLTNNMICSFTSEDALVD
jgi:hypothetical protein